MVGGVFRRAASDGSGPAENKKIAKRCPKQQAMHKQPWTLDDIGLS